ncbi:phage antirepressor KilAC domain-containing protein [Sulfurimonas sp.]|uniref:phage antirepressor KilAC domain-containing protein n=1 Tax=Sulfurimonas sp. TaxID=2022749 RepID=UPI003D0CE6DE
MNSLVSNSNTGVITLKEITDLIDVQHSKAMLKVEQLAKEPSFGEVSKFDTFNLNNVKVETYLLNKKQAIAVGARLNNSLLMKVIDRLEELESQNSFKVPQTFHEALLLAADLEKQNETLLLENKKQSQFITNVVHSHNTYTATQIAKDFNISAKLFNKILLEAGVLFKSNGTYALTSRYQNFGLTEIKETQPNQNDKTFLSLRWTSKGKNWLKNNFEKALHKCDEDSFNEYNRQILSNLPSIPNTRVKRF